MPWQVGITKGTISGMAARATGKSATRYDLNAAGEAFGGGKAARQKFGVGQPASMGSYFHPQL